MAPSQHPFISCPIFPSRRRPLFPEPSAWKPGYRGLPVLPVVTRPLFPAENNGTSLLCVTLLGQHISSMSLFSACRHEVLVNFIFFNFCSHYTRTPSRKQFKYEGEGPKKPLELIYKKLYIYSYVFKLQRTLLLTWYTYQDALSTGQNSFPTCRFWGLFVLLSFFVSPLPH